MSFQDTSRVLQITDELLDHAKELTAKGYYQQAEEICQQLLSNIVELYGPNSLKMATCLATLADVSYAQRKYDDVVVYLQQVLYINKQEDFFPREDVLAYTFKFAKSLERCGNIQDASNTYLQLLKDAQDGLGASSSFTRRVEECAGSLVKRNFNTIPNAKWVLEELDQLQTSKKFVKNTSKLRSAFNEDAPVTGAAAVLQFTQRRLPRIVSAVVVIGLCAWFFVAGTLKDHGEQPNSSDATAALHATAPGLLSIYVGDYMAADGSTKVTIIGQNKAILMVNNKQTPVHVRQVGAELYFDSKGTKQILRTSGQGLLDSHGTRLYRAGAPELKTVESMDAIAFVLNEFYAQNGRYPRTPREFQGMGDKIRYINSSDNNELFPRYKQFATESNSTIGMTLSDYSCVNQAASSLVRTSNVKEQPGIIEVYSFPNVMTGDTMIVRGFDREGSLLPGSHTGKCFSLSLVGGNAQRI